MRPSRQPFVDTMTEATPVIRLRKNEERRLKAGHLWIYANEIDTRQTPLKELPAGAACVVEDSRGKPLGRALLSPHSLIAARVYSRDVKQELSRSFFKKRIEQALTVEFGQAQLVSESEFGGTVPERGRQLGELAKETVLRLINTGLQAGFFTPMG